MNNDDDNNGVFNHFKFQNDDHFFEQLADDPEALASIRIAMRSMGTFTEEKYERIARRVLAAKLRRGTATQIPKTTETKGQ